MEVETIGEWLWFAGLLGVLAFSFLIFVGVFLTWAGNPGGWLGIVLWSLIVGFALKKGYYPTLPWQSE